MDGQGAEMSEIVIRRSRVRRMLRFCIERFPPVPQLILVALLVISGMTMAVTMWAPAQAVDALPLDLWTVVVTLVGGGLFIFRLRVFDDVKDAETDRITAPERPIPRGLISEREADLLAAVLLVGEAAVFASVGSLALVWWSIAAIYTLGMRVEFGIGSWLDRHVLTYAVSHMVCLGLVLPALIGAGIEAMDMANGRHVLDVMASTGILLACVSAVLLGTGFELGRKFERYELAHGTLAWWASFMFPVGGIATMMLGIHNSYGTATLVTTGLIAIAAIAGGITMIIRRPRGSIDWPSHRTLRDTVEALPGIAGLGTYLTLAIAGCMAASW